LSKKPSNEWPGIVRWAFSDVSVRVRLPFSSVTWSVVEPASALAKSRHQKRSRHRRTAKRT